MPSELKNSEKKNLNMHIAASGKEMLDTILLKLKMDSGNVKRKSNGYRITYLAHTSGRKVQAAFL